MPSDRYVGKLVVYITLGIVAIFLVMAYRLDQFERRLEKLEAEVQELRK